MARQRESKISVAIQKMIRSRGGFCFKVWGNPMMMTGLPDIMCCYRGLFIGFETKVMDENSTTSLRQDYVHRKISEAEGLVFVPRSVQDASDALDEIDDYLDCSANAESESE
jgi:hypothetical protein